MQYWKLLWVGLSVSTLTYNVWWCNRGSATRDQLTLLNLTQCRLLSGSKTIASVTCKLNFEKLIFLIWVQEKQLTPINFSLRKIGCGTCNIIPFNIITIDHFHCHTINMAQKTKLETVQWKKPTKWNVTKEWYTFVQVSGLCGPQFLSYLLKHFTHHCRALHGDAIFV